MINIKKKRINNEKELMENFNIEVLLSEIHFYKLTCRDIEKIYNIDQRFMSKYNKENNCGIKKSWKQQKEKYKEKGLYAEDLYDLYIVQNKSMREIGKIYNISDTAIKSALLFFDICTKDEIRPFNCIEYYDTRRTRNGNSRIYQAIMENHLGRKLKEDEVVHHLDFNRQNNDISNLFLFSTSQYHSLYHGYIKSHNYISPNEFLENILPSYEKTFLNYDWLYEKYIEEDESMESISQSCEVSRICIENNLKHFNLLDKKPKRINQYDKTPRK